MRSARILAVLAAATAVIAGCQASPRESASPRQPPPPAEQSVKAVLIAAVDLPPSRGAPEPQCNPRIIRRLGNERISYAAVLTTPSPVFARPGARSIAEFGLKNVNGVDVVFGVLGVINDERCEPAWYRVQVPLRPNGTTGFVRADRVELFEVATRIVIDLSAHSVVLLRHGRPVLRTTAAAGAPGTPTPTGFYYINQRLISTSPSGPYGPAALGISAFSPTLTGWTQGGPIAIHGTNNPSSIGRDASSGCLRVDNETMRLLFRSTPAGTPVLIRA